MTISFSRPELESFVNEQVRTGKYASAMDVIETAVAKFMLEPKQDDLSAEELAMIEESDREFARGEGLDWKEVSPQLRAEYLEPREM